MNYERNNIRLSLASSSIAELTFCADKAVNKLDRDTLIGLEEAINIIEEKPGLTGLIITTDHPDFIVGADITEFLSMFALPADELETWLAWVNGTFNRLEDLPFPTVSAISGFALGGGCELVLATDFRIADNTAQIGLPETKLGIMPGFGGTVRLPRLIGTDNALEWITTARFYRAAQALAAGVVDAIVDTQQRSLRDAALELVTQAQAGYHPWQQRRRQKQAPLPLSQLERTMSFMTAKSMVAAKAGRHYPAPQQAITTIEAAAELERGAALLREHQDFAQLAHSAQASALVGIFLNEQYVKGVAKKAARNAAQITSGAVIGAGIMGGGIAYQAALKGTPVYLKDISEGALTAGLDEASLRLSQRVERGRMSVKDMAATLNQIKPTLDNSALSNCDIVVEAVVENPRIKKQVLAELEQVVSNEAILASNTSTIAIETLANDLQHPQRCCGMHFFNPVHRMPLVEVISGPQTSKETIDTVMAWAAKMGKTPIRVNDCPGFFVNRVLFPYFMAFNLLLADGGDMIGIDKVMEREFGWPMGPAYLLDVVGIDTAHHAQQVMAEGYPDRMQQSTINAVNLLYQADRLGQKNNAGFYRYQTNNKGKKQQLRDEHIVDVLAPLQKQTDTKFSAEVIIDRLMIPMVLETVRCLEEGIIASAAEADLALVYGLGFPPFRGGVFRYLEQLGLANFVAKADQYRSLSPLYEVTDQLRDYAEQGIFPYFPQSGGQA